MVQKINDGILDEWVMDKQGPVALTLTQRLEPVDSLGGEPRIIYPPTYADVGYNIDVLADGSRVAMIDSVGSQANRLEPLFRADNDSEPASWLVPQIEIALRREPCGECDSCKAASKPEIGSCQDPQEIRRSILDLAHRAADAVVQSSPELNVLINRAFRALQGGNAAPLCVLAPTSLVFGVWDSRGGTGEKRPRLVRSTIRAWDVEPLHAAAQFNSIWKSLSDEQKTSLEQGKPKGVKLSEKGLADAPAVFRKTKAPQYTQDGVPNPDARVLGGIVVRGDIERKVTVNLVALRGLYGKDEKETQQVRRYLLGLSLMAATTDIDMFLREGCNLRYTGEDTWYSIPRRGEPQEVDLSLNFTAYTQRAVDPFREHWPASRTFEFDVLAAKELFSKKTEDEEEGAEQ